MSRNKNQNLARPWYSRKTRSFKPKSKPPGRAATRSVPASVPPWLAFAPRVTNTNLPTKDATVSKPAEDLPINEVAKALAIAEHAATGVPGKVESGLYFDVGTEGYKGGSLDFDANYTRAHELLMKETSPINEAADAHIATIAAETRSDAIEPLQAWRVNLNGNFQRFSGLTAMSAELSVREIAYKQVCQAVKAPSYNANLGLSKHSGKARRIRCRKLPAATMPEVYAVTGGPGDGRSYAPFDSDKLIDALRKVCPDTRAHVEYDAETTECRIKAYFMAPLELLEFGSGVGRIHHVIQEWRTGDNGTMSLNGTLGIVRAICRNAGLGRTTKSSITLRHSGNYERLAEAVNTLNSNTAEVIENLREVWRESLMNQYLDPQTGAALDPREAIERLVANSLVPLCGLTEEEATARYQDAWAQEPVYSAGGVIMAVQRAAHAGGEWKTKWYEDDIETAATDLLYQHVYTLPELSEGREIELD